MRFNFFGKKIGHVPGTELSPTELSERNASATNPKNTLANPNTNLPTGRNPSVFSRIRPRKNNALKNHSGLLGLPEEIILKTVEYLPVKDIKNIRSTNTTLKRIGVEPIKNLVIRNRADLQKALSVYGPGGIQSLTLKGNFIDADLQNLPANLSHLDVRWCEQITDAALQNLPANLSRLDARGLDQLTDASMQNLPA